MSNWQDYKIRKERNDGRLNIGSQCLSLARKKVVFVTGNTKKKQPFKF